MGVPFLQALPSANQTARDFLTEQAQRSGLSEAAIAGLVRGPSSIPTTRTRTSHAFTLRDGQGKIIAAVFRADERQVRQVEPKLEVQVNGRGGWVDLIPGSMTEQSMDIARWDLYLTPFEEAFGPDADVTMLLGQVRGLTLRTHWLAPGSILGARGQQYMYTNSWFESLGREVNADGDRVTRVNGRLSWQRKVRVA